MVATIKGICTESGMSVIAITHDLDMAGKFAENVTVLKDGRVLEEVSYSKLMSNPQTDYARKLVDAQLLERQPDDGTDLAAGVPVLSTSKLYITTPDGKTAVKNATFSIGRGQGLSLFGPSGAGKSTIVKAITGERPADKGSIALCLDNESWHVLAPSFRNRSKIERATVQVVPQDPATSLNPALRIDTQLSRAVKRIHPRWSKREVKKRVSDLLALVRLSDEVKYQYPHSLSGGQAQRVALARMLVSRPKALLLDEPFSAIDSHLRDQLQVDLLALLADFPGDMIIVTHSRDEATCVGRSP